MERVRDGTQAFEELWQMSRYATPLRYPGGKQRISSFVRAVLRENNLIGGHYVEPYAGGAGVALELLLDDSVSHIHINDSSFPIYAFWYSVVHHPDEICHRILTASLTVEEWRNHREVIRHPNEYSIVDVGFSALYLNRCNRSGILSGGLIGGLQQTGKWKMDARFPRNELIRRIEAIALRRHRISVSRFDAEQYIKEYIPKLPDETFVYCDPPYYRKANRLYLDYYREEDHKRIADLIQTGLPRKWMVTYDATDPIYELYADRRGFIYSLQYNASTVYRGLEVMIFADEVRIPDESYLLLGNSFRRDSRCDTQCVSPLAHFRERESA